MNEAYGIRFKQIFNEEQNNADLDSLLSIPNVIREKCRL